MKKRKRILIAYDGSGCSDDALSDMRRAGLPAEADALVVFISEIWLPLPAPGEPEVVVAAVANSDRGSSILSSAAKDLIAHQNLVQAPVAPAVQQLGTHFPEWDVTTKTLRGSPSALIIRQAIDWEADLVVAGCRGKGETGRVLLGSVSQKIANEAPCSVRITRSHGVWKNGAPVRILIGLDGSPASDAAVAEVARRFWITGSEVRLVVISDRSTNETGKRGGNPLGNRDLRDRWIADFLGRAREQLLRSELHVSEVVEEGDPKQLIVAEAEEWGSDCIFLGACEDDTQDSLLGSVATAVVARAHCSVEIVRKHKKLI